MNLDRYILDNGLADAEPSKIAVDYITAVLKLKSKEEQIASLEPLVRTHASSFASKIRRAQRSGPAHRDDDSQARNGGPAHGTDDSQPKHGGPAQRSHDGQNRNSGPAWVRNNADVIAYCRDHQSDHYWIPGAGRRKLA